MGGEVEGFCNNLLSYDIIDVFGNKDGIVIFVLALIYLLSSVLLIYFVKVQEYRAKQGNVKASKTVIFPIYNYILWVNAAVNAYVGFVEMFLPYQPYVVKNRMYAWIFATMWGTQHFVVEGVPILLMHKGLGYNAVRKAIQKSVAWGIFTMFIQIAIFNSKELGSFIFSTIWQCMLLLFYLALWIAPQRNFFRRPAAIHYGLFWFWFRLLSVLASILLYINSTWAIGNCLYVLGTFYIFAIFEPFVIYYTLLQDSKWWQGMDIYQGRREQTAEEIRSPLAGIDLNLASAQSLAEQMDSMGLGAKKSGAAPVRLLNFAYISLDKTKQLGSGSFSKVYLGSYRNRKCAIKLIFTLDLTHDVIRRVAAEAQILSMIKHTNVVEILGVSVLPPSVCILLELCAFGSLADVIKSAGPVDNFCGSGSRSTHSSNMSISFADRLYLAIGCARGIEALHNYGTELCHRDVKSMNFLVDSQLNAKLSDLELGITEGLNKRRFSNNSIVNTNRFFGPFSSKKKTGFSLSSGSVNSNSQQSSIDENHVSELGIGEGVLKADDFLANWSAPEVIRDGLHIQASDIYSFALVLWEIFTGTAPFSDMRRQDDIRYKVLMGERPAMPECRIEALHKRYFDHYLALIERGWQQEPALRPTATEMLLELSSIWKGLCGGILRDTNAVPDISELIESQRSQSVFSMFSSATPTATSAAIPATILDRIERDMAQEADTFQQFDDHAAAWLLMTHEQPHVVVRCNAAWYQLMGLVKEEVIGRPFKDLQLFGDEVEEKVKEEFIQAAEACRMGNMHAVLTLDGPAVVQAGSMSHSNLAQAMARVPTLYSLHAYPVYRRTAKAGTVQSSARSHASSSAAVSVPISISHAPALDSNEVTTRESRISTSLKAIRNRLPSFSSTARASGNPVPSVDLTLSPEDILAETYYQQHLNLQQNLATSTAEKVEDEPSAYVGSPSNDNSHHISTSSTPTPLDRISKGHNSVSSKRGLSFSAPKKHLFKFKGAKGAEHGESSRQHKQVALVSVVFSKLKDLSANTTAAGTTNRGSMRLTKKDLADMLPKEKSSFDNKHDSVDMRLSEKRTTETMLANFVRNSDDDGEEDDDLESQVTTEDRKAREQSIAESFTDE